VSKTPFIVFGLFAAICVIVIPIVALGKEGDEDAGTVQVASQDREAKSMFATNCGTCHTLAAAGTDGVVGPNLDQLLVPGGTNSTQLYEGNASRVLLAVQCGIPSGGGGRMPKGILEEEEAREVAQFVGAYAGQIGKGPVIDTADTEPPEPQECPE
jgi:mono/diheme cytochrome c family protein